MPAFAQDTHIMDLILWRHAEAVDGTPDHSRALTRRGEKQARAGADWLTRHLTRTPRIIVSPTVRTHETARALSDTFEVIDSLGPDGNVADIIAASNWPDGRGCVVVVGHQPTLGRLAALLLSGVEADWTIKKGAIWWFTNRVRNGETQTVVRAVTPPDLC